MVKEGRKRQFPTKVDGPTESAVNDLNCFGPSFTKCLVFFLFSSIFFRFLLSNAADKIYSIQDHVE